MKIEPRNTMYLIENLFSPWKWGKTYITIVDDVITLTRYYCFNGESLQSDISAFKISEVEEIGFPEDLNIEMQERTCGNSNEFYLSQEIDFKTKTTIVALNAHPYTKKQIRLLIKMILESNPNAHCGKYLSKVLHLN